MPQYFGPDANIRRQNPTIAVNTRPRPDIHVTRFWQIKKDVSACKAAPARASDVCNFSYACSAGHGKVPPRLQGCHGHKFHCKCEIWSMTKPSFLFSKKTGWGQGTSHSGATDASQPVAAAIFARLDMSCTCGRRFQIMGQSHRNPRRKSPKAGGVTNGTDNLVKRRGRTRWRGSKLYFGKLVFCRRRKRHDSKSPGLCGSGNPARGSRPR